MSSLRDKIFTAKDLAFEDVDVPEWDVILRVHQRSSARILEMNDYVSARRDDGMFIVAVFCVTDTDNNPLFSMPTPKAPDAPDDIPAMKEKSMRIWNRLQKVALRLNDTDDKAVKDAKKNSGVAPISGSPIASPAKLDA